MKQDFDEIKEAKEYFAQLASDMNFYTSLLPEDKDKINAIKVMAYEIKESCEEIFNSFCEYCEGTGLRPDGNNPNPRNCDWCKGSGYKRYSKVI
jgi:hypothetical protein